MAFPCTKQRKIIKCFNNTDPKMYKHRSIFLRRFVHINIISFYDARAMQLKARHRHLLCGRFIAIKLFLSLKKVNEQNNEDTQILLRTLLSFISCCLSILFIYFYTETYCFYHRQYINGFYSSICLGANPEVWRLLATECKVNTAGLALLNGHNTEIT